MPLTMDIPAHIRKWLHDRTLTDEIIAYAKLSYDGRLVIPIFSPSGEHLFNKYRRDPQSNEGPKYKYDTGSHLVLYNQKEESPKGTVYLCEGELDCLATLSAGGMAFSSTGGAGSFDEAWGPYFQEAELVKICYDEDEAGMKGALKVHRFLTNSVICHIPGDVTDMLMAGKEPLGVFNLDLTRTTSPIPNQIGKCQKEIKAINKRLEKLLLLQRECRKQDDFWGIRLIDFAKEEEKEIKAQVENHIRRLRFNSKSKDKKGPISPRDIEQAKAYPISQLLDFDRQGFCKSLWRPEEKTASMKYYPKTNHVYCFSSKKKSDAIDVYAHLHNIEIDPNTPQGREGFVKVVKALI